MSDTRILTSEEVDAILKASQEQSQDLSNIISNEAITKQGKQYSYGLVNINEVTRAECEKNLSSFLRKKVLVKSKTFNSAKLTTCLNEGADKKVYSMFRIMPQDYFGIFIIDYLLLHQAINLVYGGRVNAAEPTFSTPGKIGTIIAEKICQVFLTCFTQACQEYGEIICDVIKTTASLELISNMGLSDDDPIIMMELAVFLDEIESPLKILFSEDFLSNFIPARKDDNRHREKDFWKTAIKSQVVDSLVTISVTLPDVNIKVNDFMALKNGDTIPISDPTTVYICLNNIKLFRATAGQSNNKRVAKIISQI
jgi:flagellar motor switch protein FliM